MMRRMRLRVGLAVAIILASCATQAPAAPVPPASAYEGASTSGGLDREALEDEVLDPASLGAALDDAGFGSGAYRRWALARTAGVRELEARALRFGSDDGARTYLAWLRAHPAEVVGSGSVEEQGDHLVFAHEPDGCCPGKDTSRVVVAWAAGDLVWWVHAAGPQADLSAAMSVVNAIEGGTDGS
jgi:hypothetical protein